MQRYPTIFLVVFGLSLLPIHGQTAGESLQQSEPEKPFLYLTRKNFDEDLLSAKKRIVGSKTGEEKTKLEKIISGLSALPQTPREGVSGKSCDEATKIFRQYSNELYEFFTSAKEFVVQRKDQTSRMSDYREILDDHDKTVLKTFGDIIKPEEDILLVCNERYISEFNKEETSGYKHSSSSLVNCIFRLLVADMATNMNMFSVETSQSIVKTMFMASPEAAACVYVNGYVTGEYLALPLVVAEKMLQVLPRRGFAKFTVELASTSADVSSSSNSKLIKEVQGAGLSVEAVIGYTINKLVKYYESLGTELFCKLKAKVMDAFGPYSASALAFTGSHVHTCIAKLPVSKTNKPKAYAQMGAVAKI